MRKYRCRPDLHDGACALAATEAARQSGAYSTEASTIILAGNASVNVQVTQISWSSSTGASGSAVLASSGWSAANMPLQPGLNTLTVTPGDAAGNSSAAQLAVTRSGATAGVTVYALPPAPPAPQKAR